MKILLAICILLAAVGCRMNQTRLYVYHSSDIAIDFSGGAQDLVADKQIPVDVNAQVPVQGGTAGDLNDSDKSKDSE